MFTIDNIGRYPENTVEIYNRWGVLVLRPKYNNQINNFNGTHVEEHQLANIWFTNRELILHIELHFC
jgi:hypothetical protein